MRKQNEMTPGDAWPLPPLALGQSLPSRPLSDADVIWLFIGPPNFNSTLQGSSCNATAMDRGWPFGRSFILIKCSQNTRRSGVTAPARRYPSLEPPKGWRQG